MPPWTTLTLQLKRIDDLFAAPQGTPFHSDYHALSGMDQLAAALDGQPLRVSRRMILQLPASAGSVKVSEVQAAVERYCNVMIGISRSALEAKTHAIRRNLGIGVLMLAISLAVGAGLAGADFLSPALRNLLSNTISILGTVALWTPVDNLLFGLRPLTRAVRTYDAMKKMSIELRFVQDPVTIGGTQPKEP